MAIPSLRPNAMPCATAIAMFSCIIPIRPMNRMCFLTISLALSRSVSMRHPFKHPVDARPPDAELLGDDRGTEAPARPGAPYGTERKV